MAKSIVFGKGVFCKNEAALKLPDSHVLNDALYVLVKQAGRILRDEWIDRRGRTHPNVYDARQLG